VNVNNMY